jgi:WD40 repeat protein
LTISDDKFISNGLYGNAGRQGTFLKIMDISWSRLDESLAVSCGSNGELQKLVVTPLELRVEVLANRYHEKTINKVSFHPNESKLLLTGCQDGSMKLIDFRVDPTSSAHQLIFKHDGEDKVTDLQFNPSPSMDKQFASGSETGSVYVIFFYDSLSFGAY